MKLFHSAVLTTVVLSVIPAAVPGQEPPRAVIARAVQALGGEAVARRARAIQARLKGVLHDGEKIAFTADEFLQLPDQMKYVYYLDQQGSKNSFTVIVARSKGWERQMDQTTAMDTATLAESQAKGYVHYLATLLPLLDGTQHVLSPLGEVQVEGQPAVGIKVTLSGRPDVMLYFDTASGLLVKLQYRAKQAATGKEGLEEEYYSDYREVNPPGEAEATLKAAKVAVETPALVEFLRKQTLDDAKRQYLKRLVSQLGDASFEVREKAKDDLVAAGTAAAPLLMQALNDTDPEVVTRVKECLQAIGKPQDPTVIQAAARLLAWRKPPEAAGLLLAYLPMAPDEGTRQEVQAALALVALREAKPDKAVVLALQDKDPQRRAAAAAALGRNIPGEKDKEGQRLFLPGFRRAMKGVAFRDGKRLAEWQVLEVKVYSKFSERVFVKP
jgi:hypothetical protein